MSTAAVRPFTVDDLAALPDDGLRHESLAGVHVVSPAPRPAHQWVSIRLTQALANFLDEHPVGKLLTAPSDVVLSPIDVLEPDLLFIRTERTQLIGEANVQGAPDLVVEILSPGTSRHDRGEKLAIYDRFGVAECWLPDPAEQTVEVFRRRGVRLVRAELLTEPTDRLTTPLLPGFSLALAALFRDLGSARGSTSW